MEKREFTLADLFAMAMKWLWVIVIGMAVVGIASFYFSKFCVVPAFSSSSKFLVQTKNIATQQTIQSSQQLLDEQRSIALAQMVVTEYIEVLDTRYFADELEVYVKGGSNVGDSAEKLAAIRNIGSVENEYNAKSLEKMITFTTKEESAAFSVDVVSNSANDSYVIAKYIEIIMQDYIEEKNPGAGKISVIDGALETGLPINNNVVINTLLGIIVGAILAFVVVFIIDINDTRIKDDKELLQVFPIPVIGSIPDCTSTSSSAYPNSGNTQKQA